MNYICSSLAFRYLESLKNQPSSTQIKRLDKSIPYSNSLALQKIKSLVYPLCFHFHAAPFMFRCMHMQIRMVLLDEPVPRTVKLLHHRIGSVEQGTKEGYHVHG